VLIEKTKIKVDNVRSAGAVVQNGRSGKKVNSKPLFIYLTNETIYKLNKMKLENNASHSEIIRCLINNADFSKLKFKTLREIHSEAKLKSNKEKKK